MMNWTHIILHHSLTPDGATVSWNAIRRFHMTDPAYLFSDIGYHFGVELIGDYYEVLVGRDLTKEGAHCREQGMNRKGIAICAIGNYDIITPPSLLLARTLRLVSSLQETWKIGTSNVLGHRETGAPKSCPGKLWDMAEFRKQL
jgi:hypothetical protein